MAESAPGSRLTAPRRPRLRIARLLALGVLLLATPGLVLARGRPEEGRPGNHLGGEVSPYLLLHATDPVDWYPWGDEAFRAAERSDRPIFLTIGYASCHWCHVMQEESFSDPEVAALLNKSFVSIVVDREERPDVDDYYMSVSQLVTGAGGWPLNVVMTPDRKPFNSTTYIPRSTGAAG